MKHCNMCCWFIPTLLFIVDPSVDTFSDTSTNIFVMGVAQSVAYSITVKNDATSTTDSGNDIIAATGANANYQLGLQFSDVDLGAGGTDTLSHSASTVTLSTSDAQQSLAAAASFTVTGTHSLTLTSGDCAKAQYLCAVLTIPGTATYTDADPAMTSNSNCFPITSKKTCEPG